MGYFFSSFTFGARNQRTYPVGARLNLWDATYESLDGTILLGERLDLGAGTYFSI
jgi:hypothetical protein